MSGDMPKMRPRNARLAGVNVPMQMIATSGLCERVNSTASNIVNGTPMMVAGNCADKCVKASEHDWLIAERRNPLRRWRRHNREPFYGAAFPRIQTESVTA